MMAASLSAAVTPGAGNGAPARASAAGSDAPGNGFERLLKGGDGGTSSATPAAQATDTAPARKDAQAPGADPDAEATAADAASGTPAASPATAADQPDTETTDDVAAAWPPPGLAGLLLSVAPAAPDAAPAAATPVANGAPESAPATALPALANAAAGAAPGGIALAADATAVDALPADVEAALATLGAEPGDSNDEATPAPLLHAPGALQATRSAADITLARAVDPTPTPVFGQEGFDEAISARVGWLAEQKIGHAHIRISPDDMGTIDVRLQMDGDKVHASFSSPHVDVRHALESTLPRLRELLGEQGFQLAHADVGQQQQGESGQTPRGSSFPANGDGDPGTAEVTLSSAQLIRQRGLLDVHA
ncbi:flagellar hook-length control protein FliK [Stenotrophomonas chelatiphaga]|uniref:flagellar hook-length control protein FliK n=1 Tax=Stenotrophomonas chelatiphaga TaxID=517011 RepID=UPI00289D0140|nr:flagellar hook-length control protein FliK [Stenotrophomonas chelatiphaga]